MSYRGNDLDLRLPSQLGEREPPRLDERAAAAGWMPLPKAAAAAPIRVDDTVLASCNHAHQAATLHGSQEVRLEHLLHGLTRVEAATAILEQRGIRVPALRRETAMAIAAETSDAPGSGPPRSSPIYEDALRRAEGLAAERNAPASVQDLLRVLLTHGRNTAPTLLLLRAASNPLELERWSEELRPAIRTVQLAQDEPAHAPAPDLRPELADLLLARLAGMEAAFRSLAAEVAADRRATGDLALEMRRELAATRAESARPAMVLPDAQVSAKLDELSRGLAALHELATAPDAADADGAGSAVADTQLEALEGRMTAQSWETANSLTGTLTARLDQTDTGLQRLQEEAARQRDATAERIMVLEAMLRAQIERMDEAIKSHERDLSEVYEAMVKIGTNQQTLGANLNTWRLENSGDLSIISNRLEQIERNSQEMLSRISGEVRALRQETLDEEEVRERGRDNGSGGGFKQWLYGTGKVFSTSWREELETIRESLRAKNLKGGRPLGSITADNLQRRESSG